MKRYRNFLILSFLFLVTSQAQAQTSAVPDVTNVASSSVDDLQSKIDQRATDIKSLQQEILQYQGQINTLSSQANSLSSTIKSLELTKKKLTAQIALSEDQIATANMAIQKLNSQIDRTDHTVSADQRSIRSAFNALNQQSSLSIPELLLSQDSVSGTMDSMNKLSIISSSLLTDISHLNQIKQTLNSSKTDKQKAQANLKLLQAQLQGQKSAIASTENEQNNILVNTKQSQSAYQKILDQKTALKDAFEQEMMSYEQSLHLSVAVSQIPHAGSGVLSYPLDDVLITQYFGNTPFSTANPQIYNGKGHTGVDFRASIGTPVKAALTGEVVGIGNTDIYRGCYSFGKWIMIKHANGLSTLYAHLSVQGVNIGDQVNTGSVIGYSGNTGYSTGPHLHFGVYATAGVSITKFTSSKNCQGATIPVADFSAYLNPLSYL